MYIILTRNGYTFAADGMDYVITYAGEVIYRNMNKSIVEREFMQRSR